MFFFFNDTATTEIYTLSLHDALPISLRDALPGTEIAWAVEPAYAELVEMVAKVKTIRVALKHWSFSRIVAARKDVRGLDRKSTRLNSSHANISYAVVCLI